MVSLPASLRAPERAGKAAATVFRSAPMAAIYAIVFFLVVMFALNRYEFGRFD